MLSDVQLSHHTVEHRILDINTAIESQLHSDLQANHVSSLLSENAYVYLQQEATVVLMSCETILGLHVT